MWKQLPKNLKVIKPRINRAGQLVYAVTPTMAGKSFEDLLAIAATYDLYQDFLTEECLRFEVFAGTPVLEVFNFTTHTANYPGVLKDSPLILLFDPGGTHPCYGIWQHVAGRTLIHGFYAPRRQPGFEVDLESICKRLVAEFRDPKSPYFNDSPTGWDLTVIADHVVTYENDKGVPGKAAEILEKYFNTTPITYHMNKQVYRQTFGIAVSAFASGGLVTVNPNNELAIQSYKSGWRYPENMDELEYPEPLKIHPYIDVGDLTRYGMWHFYRYEEPESREFKQLEDQESGFLTLEKGFGKGFHLGR